MDLPTTTFTIYKAAFIHNGEVVYVGCTKSLVERVRQHLCAASSALFKIKDSVYFQAIRTVAGKSNALMVELQVQIAFKRRGECKLNVGISKTMAWSPCLKRRFVEATESIK